MADSSRFVHSAFTQRFTEWGELLVQTTSARVEGPPAGRRRAGVVGMLEYDAATEGFPRVLVWTLFWLPLVSLAGLLAAAVIFRPAFDKMLQEDFPVEWGQFALCLFVSVVALMAVRSAIRRGQWLIAFLLLGAGLAFFLLSGEEISWAQRVFGIATPDGFEGNHQAETNLHNFNNGFDPEALFRHVQLLISLVLAGVTVYGRLGNVRPDSFWRTVAPPLFTLPAFLSMPGYRFYRLFVPGEVNFAVRLQEWAEFCQYVGLAVAVISIYFALRPSAEPVGEQARHAARYRDDRDWLKLLAPAGIILFMTLVFAVMTLFSGITPGNAL